MAYCNQRIENKMKKNENTVEFVFKRVTHVLCIEFKLGRERHLNVVQASANIAKGSCE